MMAGRGLVARFLYSIPVSTIGHRSFVSPAVPSYVQSTYQNALRSLMCLPLDNHRQVLTLSDAASKKISDYFSEFEHYLVGDGKQIIDWASKSIGTILRISGLLHVVDHFRDGSLVIEQSTIERAIQIGSYFLAHATYAYSRIGPDINMQKANFVLTKIRLESVLGWKRQSLYRSCRGKFFKKIDDFLPIINILEDHNILVQVASERSGVGRKSDYCLKINPAVFTGN